MQRHLSAVHATQRAWSIYLLATFPLIPVMDDAARCGSLPSPALAKWRDRSRELTCSGLSYLSRLPVLEIMPDQW
jgi:hypothetical protein